MARRRRFAAPQTELAHAAPEGEQFDIEEMETTETVSDEPEDGAVEDVDLPAATTAGGHASRVWVKIKGLNVITSERRCFEGERVQLPDAEANKLIAEGEAELCR